MSGSVLNESDYLISFIRGRENIININIGNGNETGDNSGNSDENNNSEMGGDGETEGGESSGSIIDTDELFKIQNNEQYEIDGEIHHRCPYCEEELEVNISEYEIIDTVDSCSGFYGDDINTNGISDEINLENYELIEENFEI